MKLLINISLRMGHHLFNQQKWDSEILFMRITTKMFNLKRLCKCKLPWIKRNKFHQEELTNLKDREIILEKHKIIMHFQVLEMEIIKAKQ